MNILRKIPYKVGRATIPNLDMMLSYKYQHSMTRVIRTDFILADRVEYELFSMYDCLIGRD